MIVSIARVVEEEGASCRGRRSIERLTGDEVLMAFNEDNTSQGKGLIFDSGSTVHVCSQKELFNNS